MENVNILMGFEEGFTEADYINVLLTEEVGKFLFFILDALGIPGL